MRAEPALGSSMCVHVKASEQGPGTPIRPAEGDGAQAGLLWAQPLKRCRQA